MKRTEIVNLYNGLNSVGNLVGVIFGYAVNKNLAILKPEIEALQKALTPSEKFLEYDVKRVDIVKKYAKKDEKGEFVLLEVGGKKSYDVAGQEDTVENEVKPLKEEYKAAIEDNEKQMIEYNTLLEQESNVELYKVKLENVPKDITAAQMTAIFPIVEE